MTASGATSDVQAGRRPTTQTTALVRQAPLTGLAQCHERDRPDSADRTIAMREER